MKDPSKCRVPYCRTDRIRHRSMCYKHRTAAWRKRNPYRSYYITLKSHAKLRGREFGITFEDFMFLCAVNGWRVMPKEFKNKNKRLWASVDRIDANKGYIRGNIQVLTISDNSTKGVTVDKFNINHSPPCPL